MSYHGRAITCYLCSLHCSRRDLRSSVIPLFLLPFTYSLFLFLTRIPHCCLIKMSLIVIYFIERCSVTFSPHHTPSHLLFQPLHRVRSGHSSLSPLCGCDKDLYPIEISYVLYASLQSHYLIITILLMNDELGI